MPSWTRVAAAAATLLLSLPATASDVTIAVGGAFTSLDPHYHNLTPNSALTQHLFDRLVHPDADLRPQPGLALSWEAVTPTIWEFRLREAQFHDGTPFTADDVAFTLSRVPAVQNGPGGYAIYTRPVREVVVVDERTVRLVTTAPAPLIPAFMAALPMVGRRHGEGAAPRTTTAAAPRSAPVPIAWSPTPRATASCSSGTINGGGPRSPGSGSPSA
jgi:peptide/nickel transport system substrate-binding protein